MIQFLRKLLPTYIPPEVASKGSLIVNRERILQSILISMLVASIPLIILAGRTEYLDGKWYFALTYILFFLTLFLATLNRKWPQTVRSGLIIAIVYLLGFLQFFDSSLPGEFRFYITTASALTTLLLGFIPGLYTVGFGFLSIVIIHLLVTLNPKILPDYDLYLRSPHWANGLFLYTLFASTLAYAIGTLVNGLQEGLRENENLVTTLEKQRGLLEETIQARTLDIQRRLIQMRTAAEITRTISRLRDAHSLLSQIVDLIRERFDFYYVGIFILDPSGRFAVLKAGTGEAGRIMLEQGHRLAVGGNSMIGWCIANRQPRIALDVGEEAVRFSNPYLPRTRSEVAIPILYHTEVLGAMTFQSVEPNAFDQDDILVLQGIADSLGVALENANLFAELSRNLEEINLLNRNYVQKAWSQIYESEKLAFEYQGAGGSSTTGNGKTVKVPLLLRNQLIGEMVLEMDEEELTPEDQTFLESVATQTAVALENARLVQESEWRVYQERKLNDMSAELYRSASLEGILKSAVQQLGSLPNVAEVSIQLLSPEELNEDAAFTGKERAG
ncbi:MAG TPA: hypothetical protein DEQ80_08420 [Anaerolinea thermolimosa]|uniref:GAF domain-containing protein n=1 Tax=Anaerolinea thermolimosa TaxID=229919 RepID=A0A3D1JJC5_9CHLR|nr:GAF domain-containing protein [Anaerolinea thermolimosa]GAP06288.1 protein containing FOG: FHA domain [Anaerolinea thermolimosa]HCE17868.1 hypothetical protein [Anaerolinea thermolimosa]